ncbi:MAG: metal ABC transporter permease [candidate division KSB1 bacterium]|nr:metal ABC transporter permease [candidate division KSB1 bacterium]
MIDLLYYEFMQRALIVGAVTGALCAVIGVYVVLRGMAFIGAGISHAAFGGVAVGLLLGVDPFLSALIFCTAVAVGIGYVSEKGQIREDTAVGIFFASTMAFGVLLVGLIKSYTIDLFGYIFGNILAITDFDFWASLVTAVLVIGFILYFYKEFLFITFDQEAAQVSGLPVRTLNYLMLTLIAITIVQSIKATGIVLVSALLVAPAAAAHQLVDDFKRMMTLAVIFGVSSAWIGLLISSQINTASGATIVMTATIIFFISAIFSPRRRSLRKSLRSLKADAQKQEE